MFYLTNTLLSYSKKEKHTPNARAQISATFLQQKGAVILPQSEILVNEGRHQKQGIHFCRAAHFKVVWELFCFFSLRKILGKIVFDFNYITYMANCILCGLCVSVWRVLTGFVCECL